MVKCGTASFFFCSTNKWVSNVYVSESYLNISAMLTRCGYHLSGSNVPGSSVGDAGSRHVPHTYSTSGPPTRSQIGQSEPGAEPGIVWSAYHWSMHVNDVYVYINGQYAGHWKIYMNSVTTKWSMRGERNDKSSKTTKQCMNIHPTPLCNVSNIVTKCISRRLIHTTQLMRKLTPGYVEQEHLCTSRVRGGRAMQ